jgi:glycosyltransferase involved in cell wall biosynthesis
MLTVAYLANQFPSAVEPYVTDEIAELRKRGVRVIAGSVYKPLPEKAGPSQCQPEVVVLALSVNILLRALWLSAQHWKQISPLMARILFRGSEGPFQRIKALAHTWLGACYAERLTGQGVDHIHVHHGYFGSWIALAAARLLGVPFSVTLHGSDLLLHGAFLDTKLENCTFCLTVSEYNRRYILDRYSAVDADKVVVVRLGVEVFGGDAFPAPRLVASTDPLRLLAVGRLHAVKDHAFLIQACAQLKERGVHLECAIAGDGRERANLESLIRKHALQEHVTLLGHVARDSMNLLYDPADVVVLTSRSEGIPLVLMEAMARGKIVLAPAITGIPELVIAGKTGFLYEPGSLDAFVDRLLFIRSLMPAQLPPDLRRAFPAAAGQLDWIRHAARVQVRHNFNRKWNLESFADLFLQRIAPQTESVAHENFVLQQI